MTRPNVKLVLQAAADVAKPECLTCTAFTAKTSMIMFTACELLNRMTMPIEAAFMLSGDGYCLPDCPIWNERTMALLHERGQGAEALMDGVL